MRFGESDMAAPGEEESGEVFEVEGMTVRSLPARNRRRRKEPEPEEDLAEEAAGPVEETGEEEGADDQAQDSREGSGPSSLERRQFEYLDHTADVILHSWGSSLQDAMEQVCVCFFSYMTELDTVECTTTVEVEAQGHDLVDMLYHLLDEFLFSFGTEFIVCRRIEIVALDLDKETPSVKAIGHGERFDLKKHPQGTEIKAITMHQMKVLTPDHVISQDGQHPREESEKQGGAIRQGFPFECYVLVDI